GTVTFSSTLDATVSESLGITAGTGNIVFTGAVGAGTRLGALTLTSATDVTADAITAASITQTASSGTTTFNGAVNTNAIAGIDLNGSTYAINSTITTTAAGPLTITNSGVLTIAAAADFNLDGAFSQDGASTVSTAGDITTTNDAISFLRAVTLTGNVLLNTGAGAGTVTFSSTLDATVSESLGITAGTGNIVFTGAVGAGTRLGALTLTSATDVTADAITAASISQVASSGTTTFNGAVNLTGTFSIAAGVTVTAAAVNWNIGDDWLNLGTFNSNGSTIIFDIAANPATINGNTTFTNLQCTTAGKTLIFTRGTTQTVTGSLNFTGAALNAIIINDVGLGAVPKLTVQAGATRSISNVDVTNNDASDGLMLVAGGNSTLSGITTNWALSSTSLTYRWTGAVSTDWNTAGNWDIGLVPGANDKVIIPNTANQPVFAGAVTLDDLTINTGSTLSTAGNTVTVLEDIVLNGNLNAANSTIIVSGNISGNGVIEGTNPIVYCDGVIGAQTSPINTAITGIFILKVSGIEENSSISLKGSGSFSLEGDTPGFVFINGFKPYLGQTEIRNNLITNEAPMFNSFIRTPFVAVNPAVILPMTIVRVPVIAGQNSDLQSKLNLKNKKKKTA
ncbi:MAG: hypothetical protein AB1755_06080, partial [Candidatus Omnitrophota bacterium]